jgi:hypothetical protein
MMEREFVALLGGAAVTWQVAAQPLPLAIRKPRASFSEACP